LTLEGGFIKTRGPSLKTSNYIRQGDIWEARSKRRYAPPKYYPRHAANATFLRQSCGVACRDSTRSSVQTLWCPFRL